MTCAIMQPTYLPWLGFFELIAKSDIFVIYDSVQFEKQSWQQRNRLRDKNAELMLTLPVKYGSGLLRRINEVEVDYSRSVPKKHLQTIKLSYGKSKNFTTIFPEIESIYSSQPNLLVEMNMQLIKLGMKYFEIKTPLVFASDMDVQGNRVEALIDICQKVKATHYYSPIGSKGYIDDNNLFSENKIDLTYQNFSHPIYQQINYPDFISHLAFIDFLLNAERHDIFKN